MKVLKIKEDKDKNIIVSFELSEFDRKIIRRVLKVKKLTKKKIDEVMTKALLAYITKRGGE